VSKVLATTPMILALAEQGRLDLDRPLTHAVPDLRRYDVAGAADSPPRQRHLRIAPRHGDAVIAASR